jgi:hypothetical protein
LAVAVATAAHRKDFVFNLAFARRDRGVELERGFTVYSSASRTSGEPRARSARLYRQLPSPPDDEALAALRRGDADAFGALSTATERAR